MKSQSRLESSVADFFEYVLPGSRNDTCCHPLIGQLRGAALVFLFLTQATAANLLSYNETTFGLASSALDNGKVAEADSSARPDSVLIEAMRAPRMIETFFWHDIAIYNWHTRINILQPLSSQWHLSVAEDFVSILQRESPYGGSLGTRPDRWQDSHDARIIFRRAPWAGPALIAGWQWELAATSKIFRDEFSRQAVYTRNNDFSFTGFYSRLERNFNNRLRIGGQGGYNMEHLLGRKDHGPHLNVSVTLFPTPWQNYSHTFDAEADFNQLSDRRNDDLRLSYGISRQFENNASDSLFIHFTQLRRDNYFADTTLYIDRLNRSRRALENRLHYRMGNAWRLFVLTELGESQISGFRRFAENSFDPRSGNGGRNASEYHHTDYDVRHHAKLYWQNQAMRNEWTLHFFSQTINYSEEAASSPLLRRFPGSGYDSKDWFFTLTHRLHWQLNRRNTLLWYGSAMRYAHETGNRNNPDHFDRLAVQANLLHQHRFSAGFLMQWEANAFLEHHVYLKATHSAGNHWRRVFKLEPALVFNLAPGLQFKQGFGILAQYIVYDFPEPLSRGQNSVFRNFFITDSLALRLSRQTQCVVQYQLRLEERGLLDWARWQQRPWFDRNEHWFSIIFDHRPSAFWHFAPGVTYLHQKDWGYRLNPSEGFQRYPNAGQVILSPTVSISYIRSPQAVIVFSARRQLVFRDQGGSSSIDHVRLAVQWSI